MKNCDVHKLLNLHFTSGLQGFFDINACSTSDLNRSVLDSSIGCERLIVRQSNEEGRLMKLFMSAGRDFSAHDARFGPMLSQHFTGSRLQSHLQSHPPPAFLELPCRNGLYY